MIGSKKARVNSYTITITVLLCSRNGAFKLFIGIGVGNAGASCYHITLLLLLLLSSSSSVFFFFTALPLRLGFHFFIPIHISLPLLFLPRFDFFTSRSYTVRCFFFQLLHTFRNKKSFSLNPNILKTNLSYSFSLLYLFNLPLPSRTFSSFVLKKILKPFHSSKKTKT